MDKEALLKIIISDLNEVETLVKSFQGQKDIPAAFIDLTERKLNHISDEFSLLKSLSSPETSEHKPSEKEIINEEPVLNDKQVIENTPTQTQPLAQETLEEKEVMAPEVTKAVSEPSIKTETLVTEKKEEQTDQVIHKPERR